MASKICGSLISRLLHNPTTITTQFRHRTLFAALPNSPPLFSFLQPRPPLPSDPHLFSATRFFSTARRNPTRSKKVDIGARARQLQSRRLWTYAATFSCIAGFIIIVISQFQEQLVFYVTPTDCIAQFTENPSKKRFRLGGLVLEGSVAHPTDSELEFVITDLITDLLVRYEGPLPDLFREGHSVVVEGFIKPITDEIKEDKGLKSHGVSRKARSEVYYFSGTEVLAKHDEKYMPQEVASAIEKNKKKLAEEAAIAVASGNAGQQPSFKPPVASS